MKKFRSSTMILFAALLFPVFASPQSSSHVDAKEQFIGIWRLASWEKEYEDGSTRSDPRSGSYIIYTDTGHMCWVAMDPNRSKWSEEPTQEQKLEAYDGLGAYCASVEVNLEEGYVIHHVELAKSPNAVGIQRKRWFNFEGRDRLHLRGEPSENVLPLIDSRLVWERVK